MITTKNNQTTKVLLFGNKAYTCLLENGNVVGFTPMPYLYVKGEFVYLNSDRLCKDIHKLNYINIVGSVGKVANADAFRENIVKPLIECQNIEFNIRNFAQYANVQNFSDAVVEKINNFKKLADSYVHINDDFVSRYSKNIPKEWVREMFHGVDISANESCIRESNIANGLVFCDTMSVMTTEEKINSMGSISKMRAQGIMQGLGEQVVKANRKNSNVKY